jgi:hypothetical protein
MHGASKKRFSEELEQVFDHFPNYHKKRLFGDLMQNCGEVIFSNIQTSVRVYMNIGTTIVL